MDRITDRNVTDWIERFVAIIKEKYSPEKVLLFGSRARGDNLIGSDVDMIIVSKKFEGVNWLTRIRDVSVLWEGLVPLEPICYTPGEFEEKKRMIGIVSEAMREGVELT
ncbi:MAG TPA: nucleotidyltransferase domain-containing protein [Methanocella sp.]|uniref:nucleotidyltransferase domain-containing protein n=1 Tax=Methanocella sp. TaxID=2052833 RepID=UPI002B6EA40F|nr:nucleotidyltransferase domain-containing protein [Methanocella sp.]HTY89735.1 nucleotidyltransferase domain-containing protein [Methanocella sp.]